MAKKLTNNLGLKILAVLIASLLWLIAININDPVGQQTYTVNVQMVNLSKLTDNNKYVEVLEGSDTIRVTVRAARSVLSELSDMALSIELAKSHDGSSPSLSAPLQSSPTHSAQPCSVPSECSHQNRCPSSEGRQSHFCATRSIPQEALPHVSAPRPLLLQKAR